MDPKLLNSRKAECFTAQELMLNQAQESKVQLTAAQVALHNGDLNSFYDMGNLAGRCKRCHDIKNARGE